MKTSKTKYKFKEDLIMSFDEVETKYSIYIPENDKLLIFNGALAVYLKDLGKQALFDAEKGIDEIVNLCPQFDASEVRSIFLKAEKLMVENGTFEST